MARDHGYSESMNRLIDRFARLPGVGRRTAERLFILAGRGDRVTPPAQAEALWQHWRRPEIHWFAGSHLAQIGRGDGFRKLRRKLDGLRGASPPSEADTTTP